MSFTPITPEQRETSRLKQLADQEYARQYLITDYKDADYWKAQASLLGIRMPRWWIAGVETKYIRRACKTLSIEVSDFVNSTGFNNLKEFTSQNWRWTAFAMVGLVIEHYLETKDGITA